MIVYRFERDGIGPFIGRTKVVFRRGLQTRTQKKAHAVFVEQARTADFDRRVVWSKIHNKKEYMFGCKSKQQLRAYFSGDFKNLFAEGYRIKRYNVPSDEVLDIGCEVAFPVKYHKFQSLSKLRRTVQSI